MKENFKLAQEFLKESGIQGFCDEFSCLNLKPIKRRSVRIHDELFELNKFETVLISPYYYRYYVEYSNFFRKLAYAHLELRFQKFKNLI